MLGGLGGLEQVVGVNVGFHCQRWHGAFLVRAGQALTRSNPLHHPGAAYLLLRSRDRLNFPPWLTRFDYSPFGSSSFKASPSPASKLPRRSPDPTVPLRPFPLPRRHGFSAPGGRGAGAAFRQGVSERMASRVGLRFPSRHQGAIPLAVSPTTTSSAGGVVSSVRLRTSPATSSRTGPSADSMGAVSRVSRWSSSWER